MDKKNKRKNINYLVSTEQLRIITNMCYDAGKNDKKMPDITKNLLKIDMVNGTIRLY